MNAENPHQFDPNAKSAIVIGAGFGGLALAIRLQSAGIQTTVLERRDKPGGRAYVYEDKGFVFDGGPTVITDPDCLKELWELSGRDIADYIDLLPIDPFYQLCWEDGYRFNYTGDQDRLEAQIEAKSPGDVKGYRKFLAYSRELYRVGYHPLCTKPFLNFWSMVQIMPTLARLQAQRSVHGKVASYIKDEQLRQVFSFHPLLVGGNPFDTSAIYALIHALERDGGVWFAKGGTGALIKAMAKLVEDLGGEVRCNQNVEQITMEEGRATGVIVNGERMHSDMIASNADIMHTYEKMLSGHPRGAQKTKSLKKKSYSMGLFVIYFGLNQPPPEDLEHHVICFGPRYKELIHEIFNDDGLAEDFSLYLHCPSVTDPDLAPEGCSSYYVLSPVPHLGTADIDWDEVGPKYRDRILDYLDEKYVPGLKENLATVRYISPYEFRDDLNAHLGSAFSVEPILMQSAYFRPHNRDDVIPNLYLVGAGTHPGAGIPGVVGSAKATASVVLQDFDIAAPAVKLTV
ncbi:MAG: phytoene desaturase [Pseudomonadota bacterium]